MTSLLSDLESLGNGIDTGLGKAEGEIITYLKNLMMELQEVNLHKFH